MGTYTRSHSFTSGEKPTEAQWNVDIDGIITLCNGQLDKANVDSSSTDGIVTMDEAQTISGAKTFSSDILTSGSGIVVGASSQVVISDGGGATNATPEVQVLGTGFDDSAALLACFSTTATRAAAPTLALMKSGHGTLGSNTVVTDNEILGSIIAYGADGTDFESPAAAIEFAVDGTPGTGAMPGEIKMYTTADSGETLTLALTISAAQAATFAGPVTVGSAASGKDVIFHSGTSGDNLTWDASEEVLQITGTNGQTSLDVLDGDVRVVDKLYFYDRGGEYLSSDGSTLTITGAVSTSSTLSTTGALTIGTVAAAGSDTDKFLVLDGSGNVDYRTGAQVLSDIGGTSGSAADDISTGDAAVSIATSSGNITLDAQANDADVIIKVDDGGASVTALTLDGSDEGNAIFVNDIQLKSDSAVLEFGADLDTKLTHTDGTGLTLNSTNKLTFGDAASFVQQSADGTLRIDGEAIIDLNASTRVDVSADIKVGGEVQTASIGYTDGDNAITIADGGICTFPQTITATGDVSVGDDLLIASGGLINFASSNVVLTHSSGVLNVSTGALQVGGVAVSTSSGAALTGSTNNTITTVTGANAFQGEANLTFDGSTLTLTGDAVLAGTPQLFINETSNDSQGIGLTILADSINEVIALKHPGVVHGMTDIAENDTYGRIQASSATTGCLQIDGLSDAAAVVALQLRGMVNGAADTTKGTAATGCVAIDGYIKSGSFVGAPGANENLLYISAAGVTRFIFDTEGSGHADVEWTTYDKHDDIALITEMEEILLAAEHPSQTPRRHYMESTRIIGKGSWHMENGKPRAMVDFTKLAMLHHGAHVQTGEKLNAIFSRQDSQQEQLDSIKAKLLLLKG
jgi:hypothetical protein